MGSSHSTTLVLVGDGTPEAIGALDRFANVSTATFAGRPDDVARRWMSGAHSPYLAHDWDPLAHVASAWVEFFDDRTTLGTLDLEVDRAVEAFTRGELTMPDYYVVVDPEKLSPTWKHWWLGVLSQAAPTRVIPWADDGAASLGRIIRTLPTSRPWPTPQPWLSEVARTIPGQITTTGTASIDSGADD